MKIIACADTGVACDFVARGETDEAVIEQTMVHVRQVHPDKLEQLKQQMTDAQLLGLMRSMIQEE